MGKARNLSVLLAADGQVEDAKIDGVSSSKLSGALPAISAENLTSIPAGELTGTISDSRLSSGQQTVKLPLSGGTMTGNIVMSDDTSIGISDSDERIEFDGAGDISLLGCKVGIGISSPSGILQIEGTTDHLKLTYPSVASYILDVKSGGDFAIDKDGSERMRIDASGNVGIGVTPESWHSNYLGLQVKNASLVGSGTTLSLIHI